MSRIVTASAAALVAGWVVAGSAATANAHAHKPCNCGPLHPTVHVRTVHPAASYTRYHDRSVTAHVPRYHQIVTVTRIQPIVHIHDVTRIHHRTVFYVKNTYASETKRLAPITYVTHSVVNIHEGCACHY